MSSNTKPDVPCAVPVIDDWVTFESLEHETAGEITVNQLNWVYRNRDVNGYAKAFRKFGRKRRVSKSLLAVCLYEQGSV